ncbi:hypothetical protein ASE00_09650 [Sphingomonas sp. Root710]|nr:hypothetical protein ASE00_09650 [Sphingomonas sp. Root710]
MRKFGLYLALLTGSVAGGALYARSGTGNSMPATLNWLAPADDASEQRFVPLDQINATNVSQLGLAWSLDLPEERTALAGSPLAVDGRLYFSGAMGIVYAVDAVSGRLLWQYDPQTNAGAPREARLVYSNNRGVAWWKGKIYVALKDGRMVAIDAKSGKPVWISRFLREGDRSTSSGAPRIFNGKVIIGNSGAEYGARGYVTTLDAETGKILWRFFTVPGNPAVDSDETTRMAAASWSGEWWKWGGGGTPWNGITYDEALDQIYVGVGNGGPWDWKARGKKGQDNLFLSSVVALDATTGKYKWHYQYNPQEAWDWKATSSIILADLDIGGQKHKVLMQAPSNGFFYVIDRTSGKLLSAEKYGKANWADKIDLATGRPIEKPDIRYENGPVVIYPGVSGVHNWQASSYNPRTGLVYLPTMQTGMRYSSTTPEQNAASGSPARLGGWTGVNVEPYVDPKDPRDNKGSLVAWDPVLQKQRWKADYSSLWNGGTVTTAGNLVFQGTQDGLLRAFDASTGRQLWSFKAGLGILAAPTSYSFRGKQYVSVLVGYGGAGGTGGPPMQYGWKYGLQPRRLLTFVLGGKARLPATAPPDFSTHALDDPKIAIDAQQAGKGGFLFAITGCGTCHGPGAQSTGGAPDLRESQIAFDRQFLGTFLRSGAAVTYNMPKFDDLTEDQIDALYAYIRSEARKARLGHASPTNLMGP